MSVHIVEPSSKMKMTRNLNYRQEALLEDHYEAVLLAAHHEAVHHEAVLQAVHHEAAHLRGQVDHRHHLVQAVHQEALHEVHLEVLVVVHLPADQKEALQKVQNVALQNE